MNTKTIKAVLKKKFNAWLATIEDDSVRKLVEQNTIITGGCIASMLMNEAPNDIDLYFRDKETVKAVAEYYIEQWNSENPKRNDATVIDGAEHVFRNTTAEQIKILVPSEGIAGDDTDGRDDMAEILESLEDAPEATQEEPAKKQYRPIFITMNAITLSNKIQIVVRFYGEPGKIHETYDFEHCCCYWDSKDGTLVTPEKALLAIMNKYLFYRGSRYPLCSIVRMRKFIKRGWTINAGQILKMAFQVSELNLHDIDVLEDQLIGVDTAYFIQVVNALRTMADKNPEFSFDSTYLATIVDRIF
ncbi:MAG: hypothetical protein DRP56_09885 [Planctomycetota bacterium]|nr:MAG: hypothetical protein DRP56_09885 [Planctomycetota bacterium]